MQSNPAANSPSKIRRLGPDDVQAYRDLMLFAYDASPESFTSTRREREQLPIAWWENRLGNAPGANEFVYGAIDGKTLVGVCGLSRQTGDKTAHKVKVLGMFVHESARGTGLGEALLSAILDHARQIPGTAIAQLTVSQGNESARRLYERHGFAAFGTEPMAVAIADAYVDKIHMWRELKS